MKLYGLPHIIHLSPSKAFTVCHHVRDLPIDVAAYFLDNTCSRVMHDLYPVKAALQSRCPVTHEHRHTTFLYHDETHVSLQDEANQTRLPVIYPTKIQRHPGTLPSQTPNPPIT